MEKALQDEEWNIFSKLYLADIIPSYLRPNTASMPTWTVGSGMPGDVQNMDWKKMAALFTWICSQNETKTRGCSASGCLIGVSSKKPEKLEGKAQGMKFWQCGKLNVVIIYQREQQCPSLHEFQLQMNLCMHSNSSKAFKPEITHTGKILHCV